MLLSLGLILILGIIGGKICEKIHTPTLVGYLLIGILMGSNFLFKVDASLIAISPHIRKIALIIILFRAGLTLDITDLRKLGLPAFLMSFIPATFEIVVAMIVGHFIFKFSMLEMAVVGAILAAVSPAVVVPRMIKLIELKKGETHQVPQLILASASIDDIFVIVVFSSLISMLKEKTINYISLLSIPFEIILGILIGLLIGYGLTVVFKKIKMIHEYKIILLLGISFMLVYLDENLQLPFSSLLSILSAGIIITTLSKEEAKELNRSFNSLWKVAEILLFALVGMLLDFNYAYKFGFTAILFICICLVGRMIGVLTCLRNTSLSKKEKIFTMISYTPKATVQAAIGALPLAYGLFVGELALTIAVVSILFTAPIGAFLIDYLSEQIL